MTDPQHESSFVDSINGVGELKFAVIETPLVWDGSANTITVPARPLPVTVPVTMLLDIAERVREWELDIARTAPAADVGFSDYEFEFERKDDREVIAKIKVAPATIATQYEFEAAGENVTFPVPRPDPTVYSWDAWVKFNGLQNGVLDLWSLAQL